MFFSCDKMKSHNNLSNYQHLFVSSHITRREKEVIKHKRKDHGAVDKPSTEQQFQMS